MTATSRHSTLRGPGAHRVALFVTLAFIGLFTFWIRYVALEPVEIGGDALRVWEFGRRLTFGMPMPSTLNHHQARFGLVVPTLLLQKLVGTSAVHYYAGPLVMGALLHLTVFFVGLRLSGVLAASASVLWLWLFPEMVRPSSQILPELYGPTYSMLAVAAALVFTSAESPRARWLALVGSGVALFFAYGSKLSYLYFAPGCAAYFWFGRPKGQPGARPVEQSALRRALAWAEGKRLLYVGALTLLVLALIGTETLLYRLVTEQRSQLAVVEESHRVSRTVIHSSGDLFAIYRYAGPTWWRALATGGAALVVLLALARNRLARLFALLSVVYLLLFTFVLRKWSPPVPWAEPHPRYLLSIAPCIAVIFGVALEELVRLPLRWVTEARRPRATQAVTFGVAVGLITFGVHEPAAGLSAGLPASRAIRKTERLARDLTRAYERGIPLVTTIRPPKPLTAAASLFIEPSALLHRGRLPDPPDLIHGARVRGKRHLYYLSGALLETPGLRRQLGDAAAARQQKGRCVVLLSQQGRFFRVTPRRTGSCEPLQTDLLHPDVPSADDSD